MANRNSGKLVRSSNLARNESPTVRTVTKLSRLSSTMEPLESRTMMSAVHALPAPHALTGKAKAPAKAGATALVIPSALAITAPSPTSIKLSWTDKDTTNTGFKVLRSTDGKTFSPLTLITSRATTSCTDTTVSPNTSYSYEVQSYNTTATTAASAAVSIKTPLVAPSGLSASAQSGTSMVLRWTDNDRSAGGYYVLHSTDGTHYTPLATITDGSAVAYTDNTVTDGKSYLYEVQAYKDTNTSAVSVSTTGTTPLAAPSGLSATAQSSSLIHLGWTDNDSAATGYLVLRSTDGTHFTTLSTLTGVTTNSFDDKTALPFTTYSYQVESTTSVTHSQASASASGTTPLAVPINFTVTPISPTSITLTFKDTDAAAKGYVFLRSTNGTDFTQVGLNLVPSTTSWTDNNVTSNTTYTYEMKAGNGGSYSAATSPLTVTTSLATPSGLTASVVTSTSVHLTWTNNDSSATGYTILRATNGSAFVTLTTITGGNTSSYTDNAAVSGKCYNYSIIATAGGNHVSAMSSLGTAVTPLVAPSDMNATATSGTSVVLTWTDHDTSATGYNIFRSTDGTTFTLLTKLTGAAAATYTDTTALSAHTYYYQVQAANQYALSPVITSSSVQTPLIAPASLSASVVGGFVNLAWTDKDTNATGYVVLRSADGITFTQVAQLSGATLHGYADQTVTAGQKYYYQVKATAAGLTSAVSNTASVTAVAPSTSSTVTITTRNTSELVITSTGTDDSITVTQDGTTLTILANGTTTTQTAPTAGLFIYTRGGADSVTVDQSVTVRTTVETIDTGVDDITANGTNVSIWDDSGDIYTGAGTVHTVAAFAGGVARTTGASLADPKDSGTIMHVTGSLFGTGPVAGDINQGAVGDCYFLSSLAAFAGLNPEVLQQSAVDMGDGTYTVQYMSNGTPSYIRENNDIPTRGAGSYVYARPGTSGNLWAVIMEKAFAYFRTGANTYASISSGWMGSVYANLGVNSNFFIMSNMTADTLASTLKTALAAGKEVTLGTGNSPPNLVGGHAYTLISATTDGSGNTTYVVRNPWGVRGDSIEDSQGYATLTFAQMYANFYDGCVAV